MGRRRRGLAGVADRPCPGAASASAKQWVEQMIVNLNNFDPPASERPVANRDISWGSLSDETLVGFEEQVSAWVFPNVLAQLQPASKANRLLAE